MITPYSTEVRPDTQLYNAKLGMWLFLAAEAMFFGALFSSYAFLRTASAAWPDGAEVLPRLPAFMALLAIVTAAVSSARAWAVLKVDGAWPCAWLLTSALAGAAGAGFVLVAFRLELAEEMAPSRNTFYACWYLIYGLLAAHAFAGALYSLAVRRTADCGETIFLLRAGNRAECLGLYWQFLALVWIVAFACFHVV